MDTVKIFVSHSSRYSDLAKSLKLSLQALESKTMLDIMISEEMAGSADWRQWIEDKVRSADVFLLLYPHASMDMGWCNYELGRFYDQKRHIVCIKNTDIPKPPPAFQPYQAYDADEAGLLKFINELFVLGTFTEGSVLNPAVGSIANTYYARAQSVAAELAQQFADARVREQFYERRLVVSVHYDEAGQFDADASTVEGNAEGLNLLGLDHFAALRWSTLRQTLGSAVDWPAELESSLPSIAVGSLPPALPPFFQSSGIYIPVIAKAENVDGVVRKLIVIFVAGNADRLRALLDWSLPKAMPAAFAFLIQLVRMMFRARWEILQPRYQEAKFHNPAPERCAEIAQAVLSEYSQMQRTADQVGMGGLDKFYSAFHRDLRGEVDAFSDEWMTLSQKLQAGVKDASELSAQLKDLLGNNTKWLTVAARQFELTIADLS